MKKFLLTIDFEKFSLIENLNDHKKDLGNIDFRINEQLELLLDFLKNLNIKSTFFVLGKTAEENPNLIKKISSSGHEVASHGYSHAMLNKLNDIEIEDDIKKSKDILEEIINLPVIGYRAPCFSITEVLPEILIKNGFIYDSSINTSSFNSRYGNININPVKKDPFKFKSLDLVEVPMSTLLFLGGIEIPISGGGMGRLIPRHIWIYLCRAYLRQSNTLVLYTHPWEVDPDIPFRFSSVKKTFATYYNVSRYLGKLNFMIDSLNTLYPQSWWCRMNDLDLIKERSRSNSYPY